jgi:hypothetical protein
VVIHVLDDGAIRFLKPNGTSFDSVAPSHTQPIGDWSRLPAAHQQQGIHIDSRTAATRWRGESMDYDLAVGCLLQRARRVKDVSAETSG